MNGYVRVYCPGHPAANVQGYAFEHRKVYHDAHGAIPAGHHVHHRNGVRRDNRVENLEAVAPGDHSRLHAQAAGFVRNQFGVFAVKGAE